jgi:hypothetical protein
LGENGQFLAFDGMFDIMSHIPHDQPLHGLTRLLIQ